VVVLDGRFAAVVAGPTRDETAAGPEADDLAAEVLCWAGEAEAV